MEMNLSLGPVTCCTVTSNQLFKSKQSTTAAAV